VILQEATERVGPVRREEGESFSEKRPSLASPRQVSCPNVLLPEEGFEEEKQKSQAEA